MKLKPFAAASVLAFAYTGCVNAQSSVTLYGVVDMGIEYVNNQPSGGHSVVRLSSGNQSGSRWGIRGVEDIGSGLKAIFVLESGFDADTGKSTQGGRLFGRAAYVGLQNNFGTVSLGRQYTSLYDASLMLDPIKLAPKYSVLIMDSQMSARADNTVKYVGNFGGLSTSAIYSFGAESGTVNGSEVPGSPKLGREFGTTVSYTAGPAMIVASYDEINTGTTTTTPDATARRAVVGFTGDIGKATVYGGYRWGKAYHGALLTGAPPTSAAQRSNLWWTGVRWQVTGPLTVSGAAYYQDFAGTKADPWMFVAASNYAFSTRTDAYVLLAYAKNKSGSQFGIGGFGTSTVSPGSNQVSALVGIRHKF